MINAELKADALKRYTALKAETQANIATLEKLLVDKQKQHDTEMAAIRENLGLMTARLLSAGRLLDIVKAEL